MESDIRELREQVKELDRQVDELRGLVNRARGAIWLVMLVLSALGAGAAFLLHK